MGLLSICTLLGLARGSVTCLVERLLARCVYEAEPETRILLAACLGEVGAISEHRLGEIRMSDAVGSNSVDAERSSSHTWRLLQPPWQSQAAKYELQLVTKLLVVALKAAPSSADQHKIAFTIQQLLVLLDASGRQDRGTMSDAKATGTKRPEMSNWLAEKLRDSKVYEVVEPFWFSEFGEKVSGRSFQYEINVL
jgi:hypothetical protein